MKSMQILSKHLEFCKKKKENRKLLFFTVVTLSSSQLFLFMGHSPRSRITSVSHFMIHSCYVTWCHLHLCVCVCFIIPCQGVTAVTHSYLITHGYVTPHIPSISGGGLANYTISTKEWKKSCMAMHLQVHFVFGVSVQ